MKFICFLEYESSFILLEFYIQSGPIKFNQRNKWKDIEHCKTQKHENIKYFITHIKKKKKKSKIRLYANFRSLMKCKLCQMDSFLDYLCKLTNHSQIMREFYTNSNFSSFIFKFVMLIK